MGFAKQTNLLVLTPNPKGRGPLKLSHFLAVFSVKPLGII